jgi:GNAT superfamily N-acetyltransferase
LDGTRIVASALPDGASELSLELDGRPVSRVRIIPTLMRIGAAVVRMDGIGEVETEEAYRNRGYSRRVLETAVARMRAGDAALSTLFGIENYYHKFGFTTVGPVYSVTLPLGGGTTALPAGWTTRDFVEDDIGAAMRLYHQNTRRAVGALIRHVGEDEPAAALSLPAANPKTRRVGRRTWEKLRKVAAGGGRDGCRVVVDGAGEVVAYAWLGGRSWWMEVEARGDERRFHLAEVMAADPVAAEAVLGVCRAWAADAGGDATEVRMAMPPEGPVASAAAYEGGTFVARYTREGDFMGRVLDAGRLLTQLQPELSARIRAARVGFRGEVAFRTEVGETVLTISSEGVAVGGGGGTGGLVVELPQATLARLCLGGFETDDLLARLPAAPGAAAGTLLRMLFPRRAPFIYPVDWF